MSNIDADYSMYVGECGGPDYARPFATWARDRRAILAELARESARPGDCPTTAELDLYEFDSETGGAYDPNPWMARLFQREGR